MFAGSLNLKLNAKHIAMIKLYWNNFRMQLKTDRAFELLRMKHLNWKLAMHIQSRLLRLRWSLLCQFNQNVPNSVARYSVSEKLPQKFVSIELVISLIFTTTVLMEKSGENNIRSSFGLKIQNKKLHLFVPNFQIWVYWNFFISITAINNKIITIEMSMSAH